MSCDIVHIEISYRKYAVLFYKAASLMSKVSSVKYSKCISKPTEWQRNITGVGFNIQ